MTLPLPVKLLAAPVLLSLLLLMMVLRCARIAISIPLFAAGAAAEFLLSGSWCWPGWRSAWRSL